MLLAKEMQHRLAQVAEGSKSAAQAALHAPCRHTQHRCRLYFDAAMILRDRVLAVLRHARGEVVHRLGWADSSLQKTRDWLHGGCDCVNS